MAKNVICQFFLLFFLFMLLYLFLLSLHYPLESIKLDKNAMCSALFLWLLSANIFQSVFPSQQIINKYWPLESSGHSLHLRTKSALVFHHVKCAFVRLNLNHSKIIMVCSLNCFVEYIYFLRTIKNYSVSPTLTSVGGILWGQVQVIRMFIFRNTMQWLINSVFFLAQ